MKHLTTALLITALAGSIGVMTPAMAQQGMQGQPGMRMMMHDKGYGMQHRGGWKSTLTDEQKKQVGKLKLDYKKKVFPIKTKIKQAKVELALLLTTNKPNQKAIDSKINAIVNLKANKMRLKAAHKIEVRKVLNEDQRVQFDMKMLKKSYHGKKRYHRGHH